jgi:DNA-directed RNA polymerase subunit M/transcription elongation factor TFIIS
MKIQCPSCQAKLTAPEAAVGRKLTCPKCTHKFLIEAPQAEEDNGFEVVEVETPKEDFEVVEETSPEPEPEDSDSETEKPKKRKKPRRPKTSKKERAQLSAPQDDRRVGRDNTAKYILYGSTALFLSMCCGTCGYVVLEIRNTGKRVSSNIVNKMGDFTKQLDKVNANGWADVSHEGGKYRCYVPGDEAKLQENSAGGDPPPGTYYAMHSASSLKLKLEGTVASFPAQKAPATVDEAGYLERLKELDTSFDGARLKFDKNEMTLVGRLQALVVYSKPNGPENSEYRITVLIVTSARSYVLTLTKEAEYPHSGALKWMLDSFRAK